MTSGGELLLQYGCGLCAPAGWLNFDASPTLRLQRVPLLGGLLGKLAGGPTFPPGVRYGDVVRKLPLPDGSCRLAYCSHVLEHLSLEDLRRALAETHRCLREGGVFRIILPDLEYKARDYVQSTDPNAAQAFIANTGLGLAHRPRGMVGRLRQWFGNSQHLWMWDYKGLAAELQRAGFRDIRRAQFGDSAEPRFADVEERSRWDGELGIECVR